MNQSGTWSRHRWGPSWSPPLVPSPKAARNTQPQPQGSPAPPNPARGQGHCAGQGGLCWGLQRQPHPCSLKNTSTKYHSVPFSSSDGSGFVSCSSGARGSCALLTFHRGSSISCCRSSTDKKDAAKAGAEDQPVVLTLLLIICFHPFI